MYMNASYNDPKNARFDYQYNSIFYYASKHTLDALIVSIGSIGSFLSENDMIAFLKNFNIPILTIEYMSEHIGEEFDGVISGVTSNYIFVELDNTVEGAVSVAYMYDDFYYFNEQEYAMVGEKTKKKYQLGDKVRIKVLKCDKIKKTIDFSLIDGNIEGVEKSGEATRDETDSQ